MGLTIELLGTRGSLPTPYPPAVVQNQLRDLLKAYSASIYNEKSDVQGFLNSLPQHIKGGYGGNTSSVSVRSPSTQLYIDGGTGIRYASEHLMRGPCGKGTGEAHI